VLHQDFLCEIPNGSPNRKATSDYRVARNRQRSISLARPSYLPSHWGPPAPRACTYSHGGATRLPCLKSSPFDDLFWGERAVCCSVQKNIVYGILVVHVRSYV